MTHKTEHVLNLQLKADNLFSAFELTTKEFNFRANEIEADLAEIMNGTDHLQKVFYFQIWKNIQWLKQRLQLFSREEQLTEQ